MSGIFGPPPMTCPGCNAVGLLAVSDGWDTNFLCPTCGACWHFELGWISRVDPTTCPGCPDRDVCLAATQEEPCSSA